MLDLPEFIIAIFCYVDESVRRVGPLRARGFPPALTDSEVITMEIVGEYLGIDTDKGIWEYFRRHWRRWFPRLGSRTTFTRQAANLWAVKGQLHQHLAKSLGAGKGLLHIVDTFPLKVCSFKRSQRSSIFRGEAAYGYCASKKEVYYGFQGHLVVTEEGIVTALAVTPANVNETRGIWDLAPSFQGLTFGDKGYLGKPLKAELMNEGIHLETPLRKNMRDDRDPAFVKRLLRSRKVVETVISQLTRRFWIERNHSRDRWHLTNRINRKCLAHTLAVSLNFRLMRAPLHMEGLVAA